jgi:hypothetical protein
VTDKGTGYRLNVDLGLRDEFQLGSLVPEIACHVFYSQFLVCSHTGCITVVDVRQRALIRTIKLDSTDIALDIAADDKFILAGTLNGKVYV